MMTTIQTKHPERGKRGRRIDRDLYEQTTASILKILRDAGGELTHAELFERLKKRLSGKIEGSISWYGETVKLDLEARKVLKRLPGSPQRVRLMRR